MKNVNAEGNNMKNVNAEGNNMKNVNAKGDNMKNVNDGFMPYSMMFVDMCDLADCNKKVIDYVKKAREFFKQHSTGTKIVKINHNGRSCEKQVMVFFTDDSCAYISVNVWEHIRGW